MNSQMTLQSAISRMDDCRSGCDIGEPFYADWEAWDVIRAHLTQPAQAVDVGAIREVIRELRKWPPSELVSDHRATRIGYADKLTAALPKDSNGAEGV